MSGGARRRRIWLAVMALCALLAPWMGAVYYPWPYRGYFLQAAARYRLSPYLLAAVARSESRFDPTARSRRGAVGVMQVMPATGGYLTHQDAGQAAMTLRSPEVSIDVGAHYLGILRSEFASSVGALAAYNGGDASVRQWIGAGLWHPGMPLGKIPFPETSDFVQRVLRDASWYAYLYPGLPGENR